MFVMCNKISEFVNIKWFLGIPFNDSVNWRLAIVEEGQTIMGDNLAGLQAANEPDFYPMCVHPSQCPSDQKPLLIPSSLLCFIVSVADSDLMDPTSTMLKWGGSSET